MTLIDRLHKKWLMKAIRSCGGNKTHAARKLGISRRTLRNWEIRYRLREKRVQAWRGTEFLSPAKGTNVG